VLEILEPLGPKNEVNRHNRTKADQEEDRRISSDIRERVGRVIAMAVSDGRYDILVMSYKYCFLKV